jgi:glutaredoxin
MRVYYADWCGHCHNLVNTFGGIENAGKMMIQCQTADGSSGTGADLCAQENIRGFPTIKINGEGYSGARTFEAFAGATGCTAPAL